MFPTQGFGTGAISTHGYGGFFGGGVFFETPEFVYVIVPFEVDSEAVT
jgi:hypothetical protein